MKSKSKLVEGEKILAQADIQLNEAQSRIFARAIYEDISDYIEAHSDEYQNFLKKCEEMETNETKSSH